MDKKEFTRSMTCIVCPTGCRLEASVHADGDITVTGNTCPRGAAYAKSELTDPRRTLTTTVRLADSRPGEDAMLPVRSDRPIPKALMCEAVRALASVRASRPIKAGDVLAENILGTGCRVVACRTMN